MHQHADILDQQESLGGPFVQSVLLHAAIAGALIVSSISFQHSHQVWGSANTSAGTAVAINSVKTIPLPCARRENKSGGERHRVAGPARVVAQARAEEAGGSSRESHPAAQQVCQEAASAGGFARLIAPKLIPENQASSHVGQAAVSPMFEKPGSGGAGVGVNSAFGNQFGAYADLVVQRVTQKWQTSGLAGHASPDGRDYFRHFARRLREESPDRPAQRQQHAGFFGPARRYGRRPLSSPPVQLQRKLQQTWNSDFNYSDETNLFFLARSSSAIAVFAGAQQINAPVVQDRREALHRRSRFSRLRRRAELHGRLQQHALQRSDRLRPVEDDPQDALSACRSRNSPPTSGRR